MYYRQQGQGVYYFPIPLPPFQPPGNGYESIENRVDRLERQFQRLDRRVDRLERRVERLERPYGY
ncbi:hypothetical protein JOC86_001578 [Bacillus pakistanensis]|uniref:Uncharacterized protein n=1 Tax=Rossellomorea pakistanensis TaxID=992288 RepID=A0ABS2NBT3_9BACI|nr:hypothetical protein [Bacillus pakistanensis]MBM7585041.1 hypothetical protein [Bacillus pakistanensis]